MANIIIGDTTEAAARIWVRGGRWHRRCTVTLRPVGSPVAQPKPQRLDLSSAADYTGIVPFTDLDADTEYEVHARFSGLWSEEVSCGRFRTFPKTTDGQSPPFSFVLSSCNLSVVSITNLASFLLAVGGVSAAESSLDLPADRWKRPLLVLLKRPARVLLWVVGWFIMRGPAAKQPPPPYLRSPFLKLAAVFEAWVLEVEAAPESLPLVGDPLVSTSSGARGVMACSPADAGTGRNRFRLILTHVEGQFSPGDLEVKASSAFLGNKKTHVTPKKVRIITASRAQPWFERPAFFLHAGDQIYYDVPFDNHPPDRKKYRLAYREAWFDDHANRYLLSHWPQYMTLDDHEIADQFARDFRQPPEAQRYLQEATAAYTDYVAVRNPAPRELAARRPEETGYWYCFKTGRAKFFVLDTRTQRFNGSNGRGGQMIDEEQMMRLLGWLRNDPNDLKFIVTSVPFVAEIEDDPKKKRQPATWYPHRLSPDDPGAKDTFPLENDHATDEVQLENDKWSAEPFRQQRDEIIEHIIENQIERVVFLCGDMHCCYQATMQIGTGLKNALTIHELAGGPVNQLQLANTSQFKARHTGRTQRLGIRYDISLDRFHSEANAVMHVKVEYVQSPRMTKSKESVPRITWNVIRTLTDDGAFAWTEAADAGGVSPGEVAMAGRLEFVGRTTPDQLARWDETEEPRRGERDVHRGEAEVV